MFSNPLRRVILVRRPRAFPLVSLLLLILPVAALSLSCTVQDQMEQSLAVGINRLRVDAGLPPLTVDPQLSAIARARAEDIATNNYFSHTPPNGCDARCLMLQAGLSVGWSGEVLAWNNNPTDSSAQEAISMWHDSAGHYAAITNDCFTRMGTGSAIAPDGRIYHTAVFEGWASGC
jgi:uncharacterized protein YkwD